MIKVTNRAEQSRVEEVMCRTAYGRINSGFRPEEHIFRWGRGINPSLYHFVAWCCRAVEERDTIFQIMHKESGGGSPRIPQHRSPAPPSLRAITENLEGSWRISDDHKRHTNTKEYGEKKRTQTHKWINEINQLSSKVFSKMDSQLQLSNCSPKHVTSYHRCGGEQPKASNWTRFVFVVSNNFENSTATERMRLPLTSSQELVIFVWFGLVWFFLLFLNWWEMHRNWSKYSICINHQAAEFESQFVRQREALEHSTNRFAHFSNTKQRPRIIVTLIQIWMVIVSIIKRENVWLTCYSDVTVSRYDLHCIGCCCWFANERKWRREMPPISVAIQIEIWPSKSHPKWNET